MRALYYEYKLQREGLNKNIDTFGGIPPKLLI
jgi:hypothetical protein